MTKKQVQAQNNDEIDIRELFKTVFRYKKSIIAITILFLIGSSVFAYFKPNIYSANGTLEILDEPSNADSTDLMTKAFGGNAANIENEIAVIQSRFIVQKALKTLDLHTNYYEINVLNRKKELYKDSPFIVTSKNSDDLIYKTKFEIIPIDKTKFKFVVEPPSPYGFKSILYKLNILFRLKLKQLSEEDKISYDGIFKYGEEIKTSWFNFRIDKINNSLDATDKKYLFDFVHKDDLYDHYIDRLSLSVFSEYASVLNLTFQDNVSLRATEIVNAIADSYINQGILQKSQVAKLTIGFIESQLANISKKLQNTESNLEDFKMKNEVTSLSTEAQLLPVKLAEDELAISKLQTEINILVGLRDFVKENKNLSGLTVGSVNFADKSLFAMVNNLQKMTNKKSSLLIDYTALHPDVKKLTKNINFLKKSLKKAIQNNLSQLVQRRTDLRERIKKQNLKIESLPNREKELARLSRPLEVNEKIYEYLLQKKAETAILKSSTISKARILDPARENTIPIKPKRKLIAVVGLILGLILGIAQAFLREFLIATIQNADELEKLSDIPLYGVIPFNTDGLSKNLFMEAFRNLRTNIQFLPGNEERKVISMVSYMSGEGKTTMTAALSEILARSNKRVIMLDVDLRKASLHKKFELHNNVGITSYLSLQNSLKEVTQDTNIFGLDIISAGPGGTNPSELILSPMFTELLDRLRDKYDYIIMDTPPVGLVSDAVIIMNYSDISFSIVRANYTRKEFVKNINKIAQEYSHNKMGCILNASQIDTNYAIKQDVFYPSSQNYNTYRKAVKNYG